MSVSPSLLPLLRGECQLGATPSAEAALCQASQLREQLRDRRPSDLQMLRILPMLAARFESAEV
eukprot:14193907-Alexandrium_andersonii.AAC.1